MGRVKEIKDGMRLSIVLSKQQLEQIRHRAMQMSVHQKRLIGVSEVIRMAVEAACPVPKQLDMFE